MAEKENIALGIGLNAIFEAELFPFMLSSPFTARNLGQSDKTGIVIDLAISEIISIGFSIFMAYLLKSYSVGIFGIMFALLLGVIYAIRGNLI